MMLSLYKMTGAGNDSVMVNHRRLGVGADGSAIINFRGQVLPADESIVNCQL